MRTVELAQGDLTIAIAMLETMYSLLHEENPACGECDDGTPMELIVQTTGGQTRNITEHVPVVINHLKRFLAPELEDDIG